MINEQNERASKKSKIPKLKKKGENRNKSKEYSEKYERAN